MYCMYGTIKVNLVGVHKNNFYKFHWWEDMKGQNRRKGLKWAE